MYVQFDSIIFIQENTYEIVFQNGCHFVPGERSKVRAYELWVSSLPTIHRSIYRTAGDIL